VKEVLIETLRRGVKYASCYIFSAENWNRPKIEIDTIMALLLRVLQQDEHIFNEENVKLRIIGRREKLKSKLVKVIEAVEASTAHNTGGELLICLDYGGKQEVADAVKKIVQSGIHADEVTPDLIGAHIYEPDVPPCDMIVRTSGEHRLSGFMLWRATYSELMFIEKNWPDMTKRDVAVILKEYEKRNRRFGG
jgi:undecaprenyl diphosphate synthase